jgi:DNA-binding NarL/FixJ family response regulator
MLIRREGFDAQTEQIRGNGKMTTVALYSEQPVLTAGLRAVMDGLDDFTLGAVFTDLNPLMEHIRTRRPSVVLLDATAAVTFSVLSELKLAASDVPVVLWVDAVSTGFASQALTLGVRGILRKSLPIELQIKCLRIVAAGDLWVEQTLREELLTARRVLLTRRERQLVGLLVQGLKNKEIAHAMTLSEGTVKVYLTRLFQRLGVNDRFELALLALKNSLLDAAREPHPEVPAGESRPEARPLPASFLPNFVRVERRAAGVTGRTQPCCMLC